MILGVALSSLKKREVLAAYDCLLSTSKKRQPWNGRNGWQIVHPGASEANPKLVSSADTVPKPQLPP